MNGRGEPFVRPSVIGKVIVVLNVRVGGVAE